MGDIVEPPVVTRVSPGGPSVEDPVGTTRSFSASCDQPATLTMYLDGVPVQQSGPTAQGISYTFVNTPLGMHTVRVVAVNANGSGENYWNWIVFGPDVLIGSCGPIELGETNALAILRSAKLYQRSDGTRYITINWGANGCFNYMNPSNPDGYYPNMRCELSTVIRVRWLDSIAIGSNEIVKPVYTYCTQEGTDNMDVSSSASSYSIEVTVHAECFAWSIVHYVPIGNADASASCIINPQGFNR